MKTIKMEEPHQNINVRNIINFTRYHELDIICLEKIVFYCKILSLKFYLLKLFYLFYLAKIKRKIK